MPASSAAATDDSTFWNKRLLQGAEEERTVASWLSASLTGGSQSIVEPADTDFTSVDAANADGEAFAATANNGGLSLGKTDTFDLEEPEFTTESDTGGLGYVKTDSNNNTSSLQDRQSLSTNDKLRRQLLGRKAAKKISRSAAQPHSVPRSHTQSQHRNSRRRAAESDDDEEEGRTKATGRRSRMDSKTNSALNRTGSEDQISVAHARNQAHASSQSSASNVQQRGMRNSKKRAAPSYLDEMLAKRSKQNK